LDGMPALIPYGVSLDTMKNMAQLGKAWMQVEMCEENVPFYRVRASMVDTASVTEVKGGNFAIGLGADGEKLPVLYDPDVIFSYDNSLTRPVGFIEGGLENLLASRQNRSNLLPAAFFGQKKTLAPGEAIVFYELIGQVDEMETLRSFLAEGELSPAYFDAKQERATALTEELTERVRTVTGDPAFDEYTRYTFMDNVLRGGLPVHIAGERSIYVYSRKHGDLEREYNYFAMSPEYYSQGNGNYRDVNQNRRLDVFFAPFTGRSVIKRFYSLIQADGYNPLSIEKTTFTIPEERLERILEGAEDRYDDYDPEAVREVTVGKHFTPGALAGVCGDDLFRQILTESDTDVNASFGEGYWSDHWTYNLDLIEEYLSLYPDREQALLYEKDYPYFSSGVRIRKRSRRYQETENGIRQYRALDGTAEANEKKSGPQMLLTKAGEVYKGTLLEKLVLLCTLKFAALDPEQLGVEMEGGKPGWYDALNGLPGLLGSSMAETYELQRMLHYTIRSLRRFSEPVELFGELASLLRDLGEILKKGITGIDLWNRVNDRKESYRAEIYEGLSGTVEEADPAALAEHLSAMEQVVAKGIERALALGEGICPTYFYYDVEDYTVSGEGIHPTAFRLRTVPRFLEGPVRYLKLGEDTERKRDLYQRIRRSGLYDEKLGMYKVNDSMQDASYELGRCRCFTPGWLENESIWLHMEYKYLLELLKAGLYPEYAEDLRTALVPFMDPKVYGRSILENSSFIASSANPDERIHGKGFVARLSGSTIEFLSMWKIMMFGLRPFVPENGELTFRLSPAIPSYLIGEDLAVSARFMSGAMIRYHFSESRDYFPGTYVIRKLVTTDHEGVKKEHPGETLTGENAVTMRDGGFASLDVYF
nr:hypothetical protein [Lachnospiraceae bacterium]